MWALDQDTGDQAWTQRLNASIGGHPMSYEVDSVQYIAIPTGYSATANASAEQTPDVVLPTGVGNSLFVYRLRDKAETTASK